MGKKATAAPHDPSVESVGYEPRDVNIFWIAVSGALIAVTVTVCTAVSGWLLHYLKALPPPSDAPLYLVAPEANPRIPLPRLEGINRMAEFTTRGTYAPDRNSAQQALTSYGWIDRDARIVHIPIQRAMKTVIENGLLPAVATGQESDVDQTPSSANSGRSRKGGEP